MSTRGVLPSKTFFRTPLDTRWDATEFRYSSEIGETVYAIVSFTSDMTIEEWQEFKSINLGKLHHASALIDSAAMTGSKLPEISVQSFAPRRAVSDMGGARKNIRRNRRNNWSELL
jgi:hypothetical protein